MMFRATREVDNPLITDGLVYSGQRDVHLKVSVEENAMTRIGALCFIRKRERHHEQAAERFKSAYEAMFGSGAPALDNSRPVVDTSPMAHDSGMAAKIDRGYDIRRLLWGQPATDMHEAIPPYLSKEETDSLVAALILGVPCGEGLSWRPRQRAVDRLLSALDSLCEYWGYMSRRAA